MSRPSPWLVAVLVFTCWACARQGSANDLIARLRAAPTRVEQPGGGPLDSSRVRLDRRWDGSRCTASLANVGKQPVHVGNIILFDLSAHGLDPQTPVYGEAFQMLSQTIGSIAEPKAIGCTDIGHYRIAAPGRRPTVYGVMAFDLGRDGHVLLGFTSCRRFIGRFSFNNRELAVSMDPEGLELAPGETWRLEEFLAVSGPDRNALFDQLAVDIARNHPPLPQPPLANRVGWCTWYGVGGAGNQKIIAESAQQFASVLPELKFIQIDEGYTLEGDLLDVNPQFGDMKATVDAIRARHFLPAIWVAPFVAAPRSHTLAEHPDWFVQGPHGKPLVSDSVGFGGWCNGPWCALDGTNPQAQKHLEHVFRTFREKLGITYFKLDANYWGAIHGGRHFDPKATRVEAYRRGMEAVLRGAGPGTVILGCNAPIWPSLGLVNAMRTSNDIGRSWESFAGTALENFNRGWQNGRLWVSDPDCVVLGGNRAIPDNLWMFHATAVHAVGGMVLSGDKIADLDPKQLAILHKLILPTGRCARFEDGALNVGVTDLGSRQYYYAFNWDRTPADRTLRLKHRTRLKDFWTGEDLGVQEGDYVLKGLAGQSARLIVAAESP
jgi:alpha-galactosidase